MSNWIIHFLISNIFICIFTLVIIGTKKLLKKYLSATTQYHFITCRAIFSCTDSWLTTFFMVTFFSN